MPAEWEPHESTWLTWPQNEETWMGKIQEAQNIWVQMIKALHTGEKVNICVHDEKTKSEVLKKLEQSQINLDQINIHLFPTNDAWIRDYGPIYVKDSIGKKIILNWEFNMWGGKYPPWDNDNQIPTKVSQLQNIESISPGIILEGGSIDINGYGTLLTTKSCLLNKNRNPHLSQEQIEEYLKRYLGVERIIWLGSGIAGDDTDGHIDDITRFINPSTIVTCIHEDKSHPDYEILNKNFDILKSSLDNSYSLIPIPMPEPVTFNGDILPASYANFYIGNKVVLLPIFDCPQDQIAYDLFEKYFSPHRKIIPILAKDLVIGLGGIHCVTQQEPLII